MERHKNRSTLLALLLVLLSTAGSDVSRAQRANGAAKLVVSVSVPPICTVAVTPGQLSASEAVAVRCRNLPASHPQPVVTEATSATYAEVSTERRAEVVDASAAAIDPLDAVGPIDPVDAANAVSVIVINF